MSTWMMIAAVWAILALCVVLFVRGASPRLDRSEEAHEEAAPARAAESLRVEV